MGENRYILALVLIPSGLSAQEGDIQGGRLFEKSPLYRLLFALFLPNQEKGWQPFGKINDHLPHHSKKPDAYASGFHFH